MLKSTLNVAAAAAVAWFAAITAASANSPVYEGYLEDACARATLQAERQAELPVRILGAISLAESGRWDDGRQAEIAWPWTVYAEGRGRYFRNKGSAVAAVRKLQARGVANIDVGCMQVNLKYHPDAFGSLEAAFDPATNAAFAARFLKSLHDRHRSWARAAAHYHSATRSLNRPYRRKVLDLWHEERRRWFEHLRLSAMERRKSRRLAANEPADR